MKKQTVVLLLLTAVSALMWFGVEKAYELWDKENGFLWGLTAVIFLEFCLCALNTVAKVVSKGVKNGKYPDNPLMFLLLLMLGLVLCFTGWHVASLGWEHWWTGFLTSVLFGLPGMSQGAIVIWFAGDIIWLSASKKKPASGQKEEVPNDRIS